MGQLLAHWCGGDNRGPIKGSLVWNLPQYDKLSERMRMAVRVHKVAGWKYQRYQKLALFSTRVRHSLASELHHRFGKSRAGTAAHTALCWDRACRSSLVAAPCELANRCALCADLACRSLALMCFLHMPWKPGGLLVAPNPKNQRPEAIQAESRNGEWASACCGDWLNGSKSDGTCIDYLDIGFNKEFPFPQDSL